VSATWQISYFDALRDSQFLVGESNWVHPGNVTCAIYRWRPERDHQASKYV
jgi:hypothetical protein